MRFLLRASLAIDALNRTVGRWVAWLTLAMVLVGAFNAVARYFDRAAGGSLSSNAYVELQWYLFSLVFLLGAPYALRADAHVRVDVLYGRLSPRGKAWIDLVGGLLLPDALLRLRAGDQLAQRARLLVGARGLAGPRRPAALADQGRVLVAFGLLLLQGLSEIFKRAALLRGSPRGSWGWSSRPRPTLRLTTRTPAGGRTSDAGGLLMRADS